MRAGLQAKGGWRTAMQGADGWLRGAHKRRAAAPGPGHTRKALPLALLAQAGQGVHARLPGLGLLLHTLRLHRLGELARLALLAPAQAPNSGGAQACLADAGASRCRQPNMVHALTQQGRPLQLPTQPHTCSTCVGAQCTVRAMPPAAPVLGCLQRALLVHQLGLHALHVIVTLDHLCVVVRREQPGHAGGLKGADCLPRCCQPLPQASMSAQLAGRAVLLHQRTGPISCTRLLIHKRRPPQGRGGPARRS